jgi:hypothetical protein
MKTPKKKYGKLKTRKKGGKVGKNPGIINVQSDRHTYKPRDTFTNIFDLSQISSRKLAHRITNFN